MTEIELDAAAHRTFGFWHVFVAGARAGWLYTWRADGPDEPTAGLALRRAARAARSMGAARQRRGLGARGRDRRRPRLRAACRDRRGRRLRLGGRPAAAPAAARRRDLRAARRRLHAAPVGRRREPGTFRGLIEKIPVPAGARRHRRRAAAGVCVRSAGRARGDGCARARATSGATAP